jgi:anti-sigma factor RsiW
MSDQWTARLSEYLDGELGAADAAALGTHLASCDSCRATLEELQRVVERAHALDNRPPSRDLWPGIASRIGLATAGVPSLSAHRARRRFAFTLPELMAAGIALVLFSAAGAWLLATPRSRAPAQAALAPTTAVFVSSAGALGDRRYAVQVADLERALERGRGRLDTATVRVIEKNLGIIDRAIRDAQSALAADPANVYLNMHLAQEMRRKLELLRQAAALTGAQG